MVELSRRGLIGGLGLLIAAPAVVRASSLMPVRAEPVIFSRLPPRIFMPTVIVGGHVGISYQDLEQALRGLPSRSISLVNPVLTEDRTGAWFTLEG